MFGVNYYYIIYVAITNLQKEIENENDIDISLIIKLNHLF